jgi:DHA3 family macrolide efflux protein-like MFS transporter
MLFVHVKGNRVNMKENLLSKWQVRFFTIWTGQTLSLVSSELVQFALVWWLIETTESATVLSVATMIALLPRAILSPFAGALVDRWNRRVVMIVADSVIALSLVWLVFCFSTKVQIWHIYVIILVRAIGGVFHMPAMLASTSLMMPKKYLSRVAGMNQMMHGIVMVVVPPLGALLLGIMSFRDIIALDIVGAMLAIAPLFFIHIPQPQRDTAFPGAKLVWGDVCQGLHYIQNWRGAVGMLTISTLINFIMHPAFQLIAILVVSQFGGEEIEFGWMAAALGAGFVAGGLVLSVWGGFRRQMQTSLMGIVGAGLAILIVGLAPQTAFLMALGAIFMAGFMMPMCMGPIQALVQSTVDPSMQGRIFTIMSSASTLISPLSLGIAGPLFDVLGPQAWYAWGGIAAVLIGLIGLSTPTILNLGAPQPVERDISRKKIPEGSL